MAKHGKCVTVHAIIKPTRKLYRAKYRGEGFLAIESKEKKNGAPQKMKD